MTTAPDGSIIRREAKRPDLLAFEIKDRITKPDIEWMSALVDEAMTAHDTIDMLLIMSHYEGSDLGARFDAYATGVMARSVAHIRNYVVVGAPAFARAMITLSGAVLPVETGRSTSPTRRRPGPISTRPARPRPDGPAGMAGTRPSHGITRMVAFSAARRRTEDECSGIRRDRSIAGRTPRGETQRRG